jgi:hypothetical protein
MPSGSSAFWISALHGMDSHSIPTRRASSISAAHVAALRNRRGLHGPQHPRPDTTALLRKVSYGNPGAFGAYPMKLGPDLCTSLLTVRAKHMNYRQDC